jgi:hypothetical protein
MMMHGVEALSLSLAEWRHAQQLRQTRLSEQAASYHGTIEARYSAAAAAAAVNKPT